MKHIDEIQKRILLIYCAVAGTGLLYFLLITVTGYSVPCIFNRITGLECPGCGSTRMILNFVQGNFKASFSYNPVAFVSIPVWIIISIMAFTDRPAFARNSRFLLASLYFTVFAYCVYCIVRNIV